MTEKKEQSISNSETGYKKTLGNLKRSLFMDPRGNNIEILTNLVSLFVKTLIDQQGTGPIYPYKNQANQFEKIKKEAEIPELGRSPIDVINEFPEKMGGGVKAGNPFLVKNIIPLPNFVHLASNLAASLYMQNAVTGEDAGESLNAEIECASAISKLAGLDENLSAGVCTFGGTATNMYGIKMGLSKAFPNHGKEGFSKGSAVIIGSMPSHYCHETSADWLGIGQENYLKVKSNEDQTTNINHFEEIIRSALNDGKKIACIELSGGTTSNMGIDSFKEFVDLRDRLVNEFQLDYIPHIHADAVLGWAYLNFMNYDFENNPSEFTPKVVFKIKKIVEQLKSLKRVDSFGVDFHKTGFMPYGTSMVISKNKSDFNLLRRDGKIMTPLFHDKEAYNPGKFTLETSRSAANIIAIRNSLQTIGQNGYQALLGHSLEMGEIIRSEIQNYESEGLIVANRESFGCDVFVRCYPPNTQLPNQLENDLINDVELSKSTEYISNFAKWILKKSPEDETNPIAISKTSAAFYTESGKPVVALRIYPLNPFIDENSAKELVRRLANFKQIFDSKIKKNV